MTHKVKCWPEYFGRIVDGSKPWEARVDDRGYQEGHLIEEREYQPDRREFTGRTCLVKIGYIGRDIPGFPSNCVVMSIELVRPGWWKHRPDKPDIQRRKRLDAAGVPAGAVKGKVGLEQ